MAILAVYAGILGLMFFFLSARISLMRMNTRVLLGHADNPMLHRAIRAQANFAEYVPLCLILIGLIAALGFSAWVIHALCLVLIVVRLAHALGVGYGVRGGQTVGAAMTYNIVIVASVLAILGGGFAIRF
ncbi:MAG: MAPEG family protein [Rhodospirillales bacterium]